MTWFLPTRTELAGLRRSLALTLALMVLGALALAGGGYALTQAERGRTAADARLQEAASRLSRIEDEAQDVRHHAEQFARLQRRGILDGGRLEWIETLAGLGRHLAPAALEYEFAPRQPLGDAGGYVFHRTPMALRLRLAHEGKLFVLLGALEQEARARVVVRRCRLQRLAPDGAATAVTLEADCALDWIAAEKAPRP